MLISKLQIEGLYDLYNYDITLDNDGKVVSVTGNACKRGVVYAENECTNPKRTVTSTVRCNNGEVVSVKTADTVPKDKVFDVMAEINATVATAPLAVGDVVIKNVSGTGVDVVATANSVC
jgi:CxxC motif-containing protein